nr:acyltransferase family protein [Desulfovibrio sp. DV]
MEFTNTIKGFAMFMILYHHSRIYHSKEFWYLFLGGELYSGVSLFFFISGIGLSKSYKLKKYSFFAFFKRRFLTITIGSAVCIYMRNIVSPLWGGQFSLDISPLVLMGFHEWYIVAILTWYSIFIIIMKAQHSYFDTLFYTLIATVSVWAILSGLADQYNMTKLWARFPFSFAIGIILGDYIEDILLYCQKRTLHILILCSIPFLILLKNGTGNYPYTIAMDILSIPISLAICSLFYTFHLNRRLLILMGQYSLPMYLLQVVFIKNSILYSFLGYNVISLILTWLVIFILSIITGKTHKTILNAIKI